MKLIQFRVFVILGLLIILSSACAPIASQGQPVISATNTELSSANTVGQTFTSRQNGLTGIQLYFVPDGTSNGKIHLALYRNVLKEEILSSGEISTNQIIGKGHYVISLTKVLSSYMKDYYFELSTDPGVVVQVGTSGIASYDDGALYKNGQPELAQLTFGPLFDPWWLAGGLIRQISIWLLWMIAGIFLFIIPGCALLQTTNKSLSEWPLFVQLGGWIALSVSIYPLLLLFARLVKLQMGVAFAIIPGALGATALVYSWFRKGKRQLTFKREKTVLKEIYPTVAALGVVLIIIFTRFWAIRALPLPMWGDTIHHTLIAQLILDNGGLFDSWHPYALLETLNYHFGFHSNIAVFSWLTGYSAPKATLIVGQLINIFSVIVLFGLAWKVANRNKWAGAFALMITGLISFMPMFYVNWSRYTQLAGQVILPFVIFFLWDELDNGKFYWKNSLLIGLLVAGLALTHYRVIVFFLAAIPMMLLVTLRKHPFTEQVKTLIASGATAILLFLPWILQIYGGKLFNHMEAQASIKANAIGEFTAQYNSIGLFTNYLPTILWMALAILTIYLLWMKQKGALLVVGWWILLLLSANPALMKLPGTGAISNFAVFIALYIPAGILIGAAVGIMVAKPIEKWPRFISLMLLILVLGTAIFFGKSRLLDVQPDKFALATRSDIRAVTWIKKNTPADARFLVNSFLAYGGTTVVGSDGGWWLPTLTKRQTSLPPMLYGTEKGPFENYPQYVVGLRKLAEEKGFTSPELISELKSRGIFYVYIGQKNGGVNSGANLKLDPGELIGSGYYQPIYHEDAVWVLHLVK